MDMLKGIVIFFKGGGIFMYPILFVLAVSVAIVIDRFIFLTGAYVKGREVWEELKGLVISRDYDKAIRVCSEESSSLHRTLSAGLVAANKNLPREDVQNFLDEAMLEEIPKLERRTHYLPALANIATLLGLLGTIVGLIDAFKAISVAEPAQRSVLLASGVSVAMNTTAFGLVVAIPVMLCYSYLQSKTITIVDSLDEYTIKFLNAATGPEKAEKGRD